MHTFESSTEAAEKTYSATKAIYVIIITPLIMLCKPILPKAWDRFSASFRFAQKIWRKVREGKSLQQTVQTGWPFLQSLVDFGGCFLA